MYVSFRRVTINSFINYNEEYAIQINYFSDRNLNLSNSLSKSEIRRARSYARAVRWWKKKNRQKLFLREREHKRHYSRMSVFLNAVRFCSPSAICPTNGTEMNKTYSQGGQFSFANFSARGGTGDGEKRRWSCTPVVSRRNPSQSDCKYTGW